MVCIVSNKQTSYAWFLHAACLETMTLGGTEYHNLWPEVRSRLNKFYTTELVRKRSVCRSINSMAKSAIWD